MRTARGAMCKLLAATAPNFEDEDDDENEDDWNREP